jgi:carboxymethylenebutenolidase
MTASAITLAGANGDQIHACAARPEGKGPFPGVVLVHHAPGWDDIYREFTRRFAQHGYNAICPDLYCRFGHVTPDEVTEKMRAAGGVADHQVVDDCVAAMKWLKAPPTANGKVGIVGTCSGGRHAMIVGSTTKDFAAIADLWGGGGVMQPSDLNPVAPIDMTNDVTAPVLGISGNDDKSHPHWSRSISTRQSSKKHDKGYEFHRYDRAGHGFFYYHRLAYRAEAATGAWEKAFAFFANVIGGRDVHEHRDEDQDHRQREGRERADTRERGHDALRPRHARVAGSRAADRLSRRERRERGPRRGGAGSRAGRVLLKRLEEVIDAAEKRGMA